MIVRRAIDIGVNLGYGVGFYDGGVSGPRHIRGNAVGVTAPSQFYNHGMRAGLIESSDEGRATGTRHEVAIDIPVMSDVGVVDAGREGLSGKESIEAHSPLPGGDRGGRQTRRRISSRIRVAILIHLELKGEDIRRVRLKFRLYNNQQLIPLS
jgi:hypothetical protein